MGGLKCINEMLVCVGQGREGKGWAHERTVCAWQADAFSGHPFVLFNLHSNGQVHYHVLEGRAERRVEVGVGVWWARRQGPQLCIVERQGLLKERAEGEKQGH